MLTCRELVQNLASDWLDSQLSWRQRIGVRFHLLICDHCRRFIRQLELVRGVLARRPELPLAEAEITALAEHLYHLHHHQAGHQHE
jgi:anti-sigma factor ChrR (cupin superfamily)